MKLVYLAIGTCILSFPLRADLIIESDINDIDHRGTQELAGVTRILVNGDDFAGASPENPIFIRLELQQGAVLAQTLVDQTSAIGEIAAPIYLTTEVRDTSGNSTQNVPTDTAAIVRWVNGERHIWIRVQRASSTWLSISNLSFPPNGSNPAVWTIGISARAIAELATDPSRHSLPFNTRTHDNPDASIPISTLLCVDLSDSALPDSGNSALLKAEYAVFAADAAVGDGTYTAGTPVGNYTDTAASIARGKSRFCNAYSIESITSSASRLGSLVETTTTHAISQSCGTGGERLPVVLYPGSFIRLSVPETIAGGFTIDGAAITPHWQPVPKPESAITLEGRTLYRTYDLVWQGGTRSFNISFELSTTLVAPVDGLDPVMGDVGESMPISLDYHLLSHDGAGDAFPFDDPRQNLRCDPATYVLNVAELYGNMIPVSDYPLPSPPNSIAIGSWFDGTILDGKAYLYGGGRVDVYDLTDIDEPAYLATVPLGDDARITQWDTLFDAEGDLAVGNAEDALYVMRLGGPDYVEILQRVATTEFIRDLAIAGNKILLVVDGLGTRILRVGTGGTVTPVGLIPAEGTIAAEGDRAAIRVSGQIEVYDISDPANPVQIGVLPSATHMVMAKGHLYLGNSFPHEIEVWSLTGPGTPVFQTTLTPSQSILDMIADDTYLVAYPRGAIYDITNPSAPVDTGGESIGGDTHILGEDRVVGLLTWPFQQLLFGDMSTPSFPRITADWNLIDMRMGRRGTLGAVAGYEGYVAILDFSDPDEIRISAVVTVPARSRSFEAVVVVGDLILIGEYNIGLHVIDATDRENPVYHGVSNLQEPMRDMFVSGTLVVVCTSREVIIYDTVTQLTFSTTSLQNEDTPAYDFALDGNLLYAVQQNGLAILDITNPWLPIPRGFLSETGLNEVTASGGFVTVTFEQEDRAIYRIDTSNPDLPELVARTPLLNRPRQMSSSGPFLGIVDEVPCGLGLIEATEPDFPKWRCLEENNLYQTDVLVSDGEVLGLSQGLRPTPDVNDLPAFLTRFDLGLPCFDASLDAWPVKSILDLITELETLPSCQ